MTDDYFGTKVIDNYRWMEAQPEPRFRTMLEQQDRYTRALISRVPGRERIEKELGAVDALTTLVFTVAPAPGRLFYVKRSAAAPTSKLYMRDAAVGAEKLLVDPTPLGDATHHAAIDFFAPSQDGGLIAYGVSSGGSEASVLHVMETATGVLRTDTIDRAEFAEVAWLPDGSGFFYTRSAKLPPDAANSEQFAHLRIYRHRLGDDPDGDTLVLDADRLPFPYKASVAIPQIIVTPKSDYVLATFHDGTAEEQTIYAARLADVLGGAADWKAVAQASDGVTLTAVHGSTIYLLSHLGAPRYRIVAEDLAAPEFSSAPTVVAETPGVITALATASDALYFAERTGAGMNLSRLPYGTSVSEPVELPYAGTIYPPKEDAGSLSADPREAGAYFALESWVRPVRWWHYEPATHRLSDTGIIPKFPRDLAAYTSLETTVRSADGTLVPLSIVYKRGIKLDHRHPTIIEGYGNFGVSMDPSFRPGLIPWLDRGGVYAISHIRGGGELGAPWHDAGKLARKQNTIADFIACAQALIERGYTSSDRLAAQGASGGGITVGDAITQQPGLFGAAIILVGGTNALRFEVTKVGPALAPEYGTTGDPEQFPYLLKMDALHQVQDGTPYPAVLLTGGFNDPRIPVWMPAKMAARLQAATSSKKPVLLRIEFDGGHGITSTAAQRIAERADELAFLLWQMKVPGYSDGPLRRGGGGLPKEP